MFTIKVESIPETMFRAGETYAFTPDISEKEAYTAWVKIPVATYQIVFR